jgi:hypothetical protein
VYKAEHNAKMQVECSPRSEKEPRLQYGHTVERFTLKEVVCRIVVKFPQGRGLLTSIEVEGIVFAMRVVGQNFTIGGRIMKLAVF